MNKKKLALATIVSLTTAFNAIPLQVFAETNAEDSFVEKGEENPTKTKETASELVTTSTAEDAQDEVPQEDTDTPFETLPEGENTGKMLEGEPNLDEKSGEMPEERISTVVTVNSIDDFLNAMKSVDVKEIVLASDLSFPKSNESYHIDLSGKVLDLNNNTLSSHHFNLFFEGHDFVIKNGTISSNNGSDYPLFIGDNPTSNVLVENVSVTGGINVYNSTNVRLVNCAATSSVKYYAIWADEGAQVIVDGGTYKGAKGAVNSLLGITKHEHSSITINNGTFISGDAPNLVLPGYKAPVFNGGIFDKNPVEYTADEKSCVAVDKLYYVGSQDEVQKHMNEAKESVEVLKNLNKVEIPDGVKVENKTGTDIIVNGETVKDNDSIIVDKVPTATVTYSNDGKWTNQDVMVTIQVSEPVEDIKGWTKIEPLTYTKTYRDNALETIKIKDMTGNIAEVKVDVKNIDKQAPEIRGVKDVTIVQGEAFDELAGITAYDAECGEIKDIKVTLLSRAIFDTNVPGVYSLEYTATDLANNTTSVQRKVIVNPKIAGINEAPIIEAKDVTITIGDAFDVRKGVKATDKEDGDLTDKISIRSFVLTNKVGTYDVIYSVMDSQGATTTKTIKVTVKEKKEEQNSESSKKPDKKPGANTSVKTSVGIFTGLAAISALGFVLLKKRK